MAKTNTVTVDPNVMGGVPVVAGTRIPVSLILNLLAHGYDFDRVVDAYPVLSIADIQAALGYAEDLVKRSEPHLLDDPM